MFTHREYFNSKAAIWDSLATPEERAKLEAIIKGLNLAPGGTVLDVGCGTGILIPYLLAAVGPAGRVVALDIAESMLKQAQSKGFPANVEFICADVIGIPFPAATFEEVICNSAFPHFPQKLEALKEMARVTKPGGRVIICHTAARETINHLHCSIGGVVAGDQIPSNTEMVTLLAAAGLVNIEVNGGADYYLALGVKV
ncbi:class I SAM-dependent methyltransferase [Moorella sp. Hama-1]|uniref:class I SAM-dependent methyltransferase n=1 Tax=Moorella sp. Hama-1 TaxID=2138101 RepID=UPI000D643630|nr:methyltransferase domain-containing protein [Moorella sp. Hama-1]BCV21648.1 ubiquinone biosynthesis protein UbiE [Moorella sp. Hama-1]